MKVHWQDNHPEKLAKIRAWLGETDEKIKVAEALARQGLKGPGEAEDR